MDYKNFIRKFSSIIVALIAVSLGLLLPGIGLLWHLFKVKKAYLAVSPYPSNPVPYYPDSLDWSSEMKALMKRYNELCKQAHEAYSNIKRLEQSKIDKQAADLWDSA